VTDASLGGDGGPWRNEPISTVSLPAVDATPFEQLEPGYLRMQRVLWLGLILVATIGAIVAMVLAGAPWWLWLVVIGAAAALAIGSWVLEGMAYDYRGVQLRELDVSARRGLIGRSTISVPFARVQHVTVERGPFDRMFGLAQVVIFTAGAVAADARIPGLAPERAERLRQGIINRSNLALEESGELDR